MSRLSRLIPKYARVPLLAALALNCAVYWLTRPITAGAYHYDLTLPADRAIPFVPAFILVYVAAFPQWLAGYIIICRESRELARRFMAGEMISKLICCALFLALPTAMSRPEVTGSGLCPALTRLIYSLDTPDNLFPSIHCVESWLVFRGSLEVKRVGRWYRYFSLGLTLLVFASVVLVKQHVLVDIISAVAVAEIGQLISRLTGAGRIFAKRDPAGEEDA